MTNPTPNYRAGDTVTVTGTVAEMYPTYLLVRFPCSLHNTTIPLPAITSHTPAPKEWKVGDMCRRPNYPGICEIAVIYKDVAILTVDGLVFNDVQRLDALRQPEG